MAKKLSLFWSVLAVCVLASACTQDGASNDAADAGQFSDARVPVDAVGAHTGRGTEGGSSDAGAAAGGGGGGRNEHADASGAVATSGVSVDQAGSDGGAEAGGDAAATAGVGSGGSDGSGDTSAAHGGGNTTGGTGVNAANGGENTTGGTAAAGGDEPAPGDSAAAVGGGGKGGVGGSTAPDGGGGKGGSGGSAAADGGSVGIGGTGGTGGRGEVGGTAAAGGGGKSTGGTGGRGGVGGIAAAGGGGSGAGGRDGTGGSGVDEEPTAEPTPRNDGCPEDAPLPMNRVRIRPASGQAAMLVGAKLQGSSSGPTTDFVDLASIKSAPAEGAFTELSFDNTQRYRYLRYYAPPGSQGAISELQFYYGNRRITGSAFGSVVDEGDFHAALDGDNSTSFAPTTTGGGYVGYDISGSYVASPVMIAPGDTSALDPVQVTLTSMTPDALIRYTTDGQEPSASSGTPYTGPFQIGNGTTWLRAVAYTSCAFASAERSARYHIGQDTQPMQRGLRTYHLGNSLTDTINRWLKPIADSTGLNHVYARWTIPGAPIRWLAEHKNDSSGFGDPEGAKDFDNFVREFAPIDHLSLQPYADPDWVYQGEAAIGLLTKALQYNPNIQFWIYAQWPGQSEWRTDSFANGGGNVFPDWQVAHKPTTWEEATENEVLYHEAFRDHIQPSVGGKKILIVPGGLALRELKRELDGGMIPGMRGDFFATFFEDEEHLLPQAQYLVSLVFYSVLYKTTPVSRVTHENTGLTDEQAKRFQEIAWRVASSYPGAGIAP